MENLIFGIVNTIVAAGVAWLIKQYGKGKAEAEKLKEDNETLKVGFQALLRANMVKDYNHYLGKGYMPIYAKESFENVYKAYHAMGENGVMNDIHDKVMAMPTENKTE